MGLEKACGVEGNYRVDHELFQGVVFTSEEEAILMAENLCRFLIRNTPRIEASVEVLVFKTDDGCDGTQKIWWHHTTIEAELTVNQLCP